MSNPLAIETRVRRSVGRSGRGVAEVVSHRPRFRLLAATAMFGFLVAGITAVILGVLVGLGNVTVTTRIAELLPVNITDKSKPASVVAMLGALLSQHVFLTLISFAVVMMLCAFLARKVVLAGLRDCRD